MDKSTTPADPAGEVGQTDGPTPDPSPADEERVNGGSAGRIPRGDLAPLAQETLWVSSKEDTTPVAEGSVVAVAMRDGSREFLVCDAQKEPQGKLKWLREANIGRASMRAPRVVTAVASDDLRLSTTSKAGTQVEGAVLAIASNRQSTEYLVCDDSDKKPLQWVDESDVDRAWVSHPDEEGSWKPTRKVKGAGVGAVAGTGLSAALIALLPELSPALDGLIGGGGAAALAVLVAYLTGDEKSLGTKTAAKEAKRRRRRGK